VLPISVLGPRDRQPGGGKNREAPFVRLKDKRKVSKESQPRNPDARARRVYVD